MAKKKEVEDDSIKNFSFMDAEAISIDLTKFCDEDDHTVYSSQIVFHLQLAENGDTVKAIVLSTRISNTNQYEAIRDTLVLAHDLFGCDVYAGVSVFNTDGEIIEEYDLNEIGDGLDTQQPMPIIKTDGAGEYDLANMEIGVPLIKH